MKGREALTEARQWLLSEFGLDIDEDDQILIPVAAAHSGLHRSKAMLDETARQAVEHAGDPLRHAMQEQIDILHRIAGHFEEASTESRHIKDARTMLFDAINAMDADIKPLHSSMVLTRDALNKHERISRSPFFLLLVGSAFTAIGMTLGLIIGTQFL